MIHNGTHRLKSVIFDLDDTLYPEQQYVLSGFRAVSEWAAVNCGINQDEGYRDLEALFFGGIRGDTFDRWTAVHNISPELVPQLVGVYRSHTPTIHPFDGVIDLLGLIGQYFTLGIVSDGALISQQKKIEALNIAKYFDSIVLSDAIGEDAWKPSTKPFEVVLQELSMEPFNAVYIADNPTKDFIGPRQLGMLTVQLTIAQGEYTERSAPSEDHKPDQIIHSIVALERRLLQDMSV